MEAVRTSETSVDNNFTWQYIPENNSEHHTRHRENLKSHKGTIITHLFNHNKKSIKHSTFKVFKLKYYI
jgi:hypothetical protein